MEVNTSVLLTVVAALRACHKHVQRCVTGQPLDEDALYFVRNLVAGREFE